MRVSLVFLLVSVLLAVALSQDSSEESPIPKKTLRKYRIRRPVVLDENGNPKTPTGTGTTRLRRIRVKARPTDAPTPTAAPLVLEEQYVTVQPQPLQQQRQIFYEETPQIDAARNVAQYRTATSSATRSALLANVHLKSRVRGDEEEKKNIGTTRNYSHINEDGSFTFGYEGDDSSFREETRGTDCVVRGKYGYVDPDGVRREFTYVSGNPCDPNDPNKEDAVDDEVDERAAPPTRPLLRRVRPEITQNLLSTKEEKLSEDQLPALFRVSNRQRERRPVNQGNIQPTTFRPRIRIATTPASSDEPTVIQPFVYTTRPRQSRPIQEVDNSLPQGRSLFNFQAEVQRLQQQNSQPEAQPQTQVQYTPHQFPSRQVFGGQAQLINRQQPQPQPQFQQLQQRQPQPQQQSGEQLKANQVTATIAEDSQERRNNYGHYRTELVFDPATNQYTSVLVQDIPKTNEQFELTQRLRAFVEPQNPNQFQVQSFGNPNVQYFGNHPNFFQQQQQQQQQQPQDAQGSLPVRSLQFQNQPTSIPQLHADAQQIHSVNFPANPQAGSHASGQIDAFLRQIFPQR